MSETSNDPAAIAAEIERTRADLADTVDQLSARLGQQKQQAKSVATKVAAGGAVVLAVFLVVRVVRARRSS